MKHSAVAVPPTDASRELNGAADGESSDGVQKSGTMDNLGSRLRDYRLKSGLTVRELARLVKVSPSFVSQIENGKSQPSVATLYAFSQQLDVSVDELFDGKYRSNGSAGNMPAVESAIPPSHDPASAWQPSEYANRVSIVHPTHRSRIDMAAGVVWERLAATPERDVNFMQIVYAPGASSSDSGEMSSHVGYEYGFVAEGELEVTIGEEIFTLRGGESLGFDSSIPHTFRNPGSVEMRGIWFVHGATPGTTAKPPA